MGDTREPEQGKGYVVLTGSGGGIGGACASLFNQRGWVVLGIDKAAPSTDDFATIEGDLRDDATIAAILSVVGNWPRVDTVVNCAAVVNESPAWSLATSDWMDIYQINVVTAYELVRALLPSLERSTAGSVVNVASIAGQRSGAFSSPCYAASKAAMIALSRSMARLLAERNIRVNCVNPGITETGMIQHWSKERMHDATVPIPLRRAGTPTEVAEAIYFLGSSSASYITGAQLDVNGGLHMA